MYVLCTQCWFHPFDPDTILGAFLDWQCLGDCRSYVWTRRSTNAGTTWGNTFVPNGVYSENQEASSFFFDATLNDHAYLSIGNLGGNGFKVGLARTTNGGATWHTWMNGLSGLSMIDVQSDPAGRVFRPRSGGENLEKGRERSLAGLCIFQRVLSDDLPGPREQGGDPRSGWGIGEQ